MTILKVYLLYYVNEIQYPKMCACVILIDALKH